MRSATVHVSTTHLQLTGSYERTGDVIYLSTPADDKDAAAQETPEGHAVRLDADGQVTHITAVNAGWLLSRDGELVATLRDDRQIRIRREDLVEPRGAASRAVRGRRPGLGSRG